MKTVIGGIGGALVLAAGMAPFAATAQDGEALLAMEWDEIVEAARGGEVNVFMWGGADNINAYVSDYIGGLLADEYGITLNRVPLTDTAEAVNIVLGEVEAGAAEGAVDMIWINGENFRTMKQGDLAWCGYVEKLPNAELVDFDNPAIANDFGTPVEGCEVPWSRVQFAFAHDTARTEEPPRTIPDLLDWARANPGRFTYPAPPDFTGAAFVRHVFIHAAGGPETLIGPFDQAKFDEVAVKAWDILNDLEPSLWREGRTYPTSITQLQQMFANREVDLFFTYDPAEVGTAVVNGIFPETAMSYGLEDGTLANTNYMVIPVNSPNKAAAMVLQNLLLSGEAQLEKAQPDVWGAATVIEPDRASDEVQAGFAALERHPSVVAIEELGQAALPELQADWTQAIEDGWIENVGN
ncbi:ABC transporter substrate-binding protein [Limimaricola pyoseonensis]|uniref:Putative spermidine/putrescine transport system substrate-binding protein n=1 Tax=Limimaricola pyoseonensis TaxID=521013 RepID=A0A1G7GV41_9RHOB|nr:ABC transporter substrate-binding protein [Limimaricola pyoseonensis]SDE91975.1 putative spermidine/putrescine transport system substrate-binding protein [Limimaricola pyoseonensis]